MQNPITEPRKENMNKCWCTHFSLKNLLNFEVLFLMQMFFFN